jgi:hypothetical protein
VLTREAAPVILHRFPLENNTEARRTLAQPRDPANSLAWRKRGRAVIAGVGPRNPHRSYHGVTAESESEP